jgi:hypothetical protein
MKTRILSYALTAAALLCAAAFQASAQQGGGRNPILSHDEQAAARQAARPQLAKLWADLQAARKAAVETALAEDAKDEDIKAKLEAVSKIENEMALVWCKTVKQTAKLTEEQTGRMKDNPALGYTTLFNPAAAFGGRLGGRGNRGAAPGQQ